MVLSHKEVNLTDYKEIISKYNNLPGGIIEAYHDLIDQFGYLPKDALIDAATLFGISVAEAYGIATFYSMFTLEPRGKNIIRVCQSAPCYVAGSVDMVAVLKDELGIEIGETTSNNLFTLEHTECVGQCQATPVFTINGKPYAGLKPDEIAGVLTEYGHTRQKRRS